MPFSVATNAEKVVDYVKNYYGMYVIEVKEIDNQNIIYIESDVETRYKIIYKENNVVDYSILKNISKILYKYSKFFNDVIPLHGVGIEHLGKAHIFLAPTTGGKTTLTSYLINKGLGYISDDCILLNKEDGYIVPYTTPIHLRIGGFEALKKIGEQPKEYTHVDDGYVSRLVYTPNNLVVNPLPIKRIYYLDRTSNMNKINKRSFYQNFNTALISQMVLTDINSSNTQCFAHFAQNEFIHICYNDFEYVYDYIINNQED